MGEGEEGIVGEEGVHEQEQTETVQKNVQIQK